MSTDLISRPAQGYKVSRISWFNRAGKGGKKCRHVEAWLGLKFLVFWEYSPIFSELELHVALRTYWFSVPYTAYIRTFRWYHCPHDPRTCTTVLLLLLVVMLVFVKLLARLTTGKRLTDQLPNLSLVTLSPPGTDRIYGSTCHQHAVPIFGDPEIFFQILDKRKSTFIWNAFSWWTWDSNPRPTTHVLLPMTQFLKGLSPLGYVLLKS